MLGNKLETSNSICSWVHVSFKFLQTIIGRLNVLTGTMRHDDDDKTIIGWEGHAKIPVMCTDRVLSFFKMKCTHTLCNQEQIRLLTQFLQFIWLIKGTTTTPAVYGVLHWRMHVIIAVPPVTTSLSWITFCVSVVFFKATYWKSYGKNVVSLLHNLTKRNLSFTDIWKYFDFPLNLGCDDEHSLVLNAVTVFTKPKVEYCFTNW